MTAKIIKGVVIVGSVVFFATVVMVITMWWSESGRKQRSATAPAEIVGAEPTSWLNDPKYSRRTNGHRVNYRFNVGGKTFSGVHEKYTEYKAGEQFRVCYDPKNPSDSVLHSGRKDCGKGILF